MHQFTEFGKDDHSAHVGKPGCQVFFGPIKIFNRKKKGIKSNPSPVKPGKIKRGIPSYELNSERSLSLEFHIC